MIAEEVLTSLVTYAATASAGVYLKTCMMVRCAYSCSFIVFHDVVNRDTILQRYLVREMDVQNPD